jgi:hypothetical protein
MARNKRRKRKKEPQKRQFVPPLFRWLSFLRMVPGWIRGTVVAIGLVVTLLQGYPWLSVEEGARLDDKNPYATLFSVANEGYFPVTDLNADCHMSPSADNHGNTFAVDFAPESFAGFLSHSQKATLPCFRTIALEGSGALSVTGDLTVTVTYSLYPFSLRILRRHQQFHFRAVSGRDGRKYWTYIN